MEDRRKSDLAKLRKEALDEKKKKLEQVRAAKADKEAALAARKSSSFRMSVGFIVIRLCVYSLSGNVWT
jgi:hypothetical protein